MKKNILAIVPFALFLLVLSCSSSQERLPYTGEKQLVAVPLFADLSKNDVSKKIIESLTDQFTTNLVKTGRFAVVERTRLGDILKEHELAMTGVLSESNAVKLGRLAQAPYIVLGTINHMELESKQYLDDTVFGYTRGTIKVTLTLRVISTTTGASVAAATVTHEASKSDIRMGGDSKTQFKFGDSIVGNDNPVMEEVFSAAEKLADELYKQKF